MEDLFGNFSTSSVKIEEKKDGTYTLIPDGTKVWLELESAEIKPSKDNTGQVAHMVFKVIDDEYKGRKIWDYILVKSTKTFTDKNTGEVKKVEEIGQQKLAKMMNAMGHESIRVIEDLEGERCKAQIKIEKSNNPSYGDSNKIHFFLDKKKDPKPAVKQDDEFDDDIDAVFG